jgi:hypothetical protein
MFRTASFWATVPELKSLTVPQIVATCHDHRANGTANPKQHHEPPETLEAIDILLN